MNTEWETRLLVLQSEGSKALLQKPTTIGHAPTQSILLKQFPYNSHENIQCHIPALGSYLVVQPLFYEN
jgi:hypothetical protein